MKKNDKKILLSGIFTLFLLLAIYFGINYKSLLGEGKDIFLVSGEVTNSFKVDECDGTKEIVNDDYGSYKYTATEAGISGVSSYFESNCEITVKTTFDFGDDEDPNTERNFYKGEGFTYGVNFISKYKCTVTLNSSAIQRAYNDALEAIKLIDSQKGTNLVNYVRTDDKDNKTKFKKVIDKIDADIRKQNDDSYEKYQADLARYEQNQIDLNNYDIQLSTYEEQKKLYDDYVKALEEAEKNNVSPTPAPVDEPIDPGKRPEELEEPYWSAEPTISENAIAQFNILEKIRGIINTYRNYNPFSETDFNLDEKVLYNLKYSKIGGKKSTDEEEFVKKVLKEGNITTANSDDGKTFTLSDCLMDYCEDIPMSFKIGILKEKDARKVKLTPKTKYFESTGDKIFTEVSETTYLNAGNKVYLSYEIDKGDYIPNIIASFTIGPTQYEISNKECGLNVYEIETSYRPIDVKNPFINDNYPVNESWLNSRFDFRKVINRYTWSANPLYVVPMKADQISELKASTGNYSEKSPYMGLCDRLRSTEFDPITSYLCGQFPKKK